MKAKKALQINAGMWYILFVQTKGTMKRLKTENTAKYLARIKGLIVDELSDWQNVREELDCLREQVLLLVELIEEEMNFNKSTPPVPQIEPGRYMIRLRYNEYPGEHVVLSQTGEWLLVQPVREKLDSNGNYIKYTQNTGYIKLSDVSEILKIKEGK